MGGEPEEDREEEGRTTVEDISRLCFREAFSHHPSFRCRLQLLRAWRHLTHRTGWFFVLAQAGERLAS
jgi:hypothetical protein